jgi:hypothetical protein
LRAVSGTAYESLFMPTQKAYTAALLALAVVTWASLLLIRGTPITWELLWPFGTVLTVLTTAATVFDRFAWRWPGVRTVVQRPDLSGTWQVTLQSEWINPTTGAGVPPITAYMTVRQTFTRLSVRLMTSESASWLVAHSIFDADAGVYHLATVYMNQPRLELRGIRSEIHYGAFLVKILGTPATSMEGHYWTDRQTRGTMVLTNRQRRVYESFQEARDAVSGVAKGGLASSAS